MIMLKKKRIVFILVTVLLVAMLLSSCSHFKRGQSDTSETTMTSSDTTNDDDQTSSDTNADKTTGELQPTHFDPVEDLITPDPNRNPLASSDVLRTIVKGKSLDDLISTAGLPQRIEKMKVIVLLSETVSTAIPMELPCLSYDTSEGTTYVYSILTYGRADKQEDLKREVYSICVTNPAGADDE